MQTIAEYFGLRKSQSELDFVDIPTAEDIPLFIDPFALSMRPEHWSIRASQTLTHFFQQIINHIRAGNSSKAFELLQHLREPNETHFGLSQGEPKGAGIGSGQARLLLEALAKSEAVKTGFINSLEEAELMIPGIGRDKISDLATNVIRKSLAEYTLEQCDLHDIPVSQVALAPFFDSNTNRWVNDYYQLPIVNDSPILLVPRVIARYEVAYDHRDYYRHFVLNFLQAEQLSAGSSLVSTLRDGRRKVLKKDVEAAFPLSKEFLYEFSKAQPKVLKKYREHLR